MPAEAGCSSASHPAATLEPAVETPPLDEIVVTATRRKSEKWAVPASLSVVTAGDMEEQAARSLPEALEALPSVMVQKTAYGQGSPYIRGFTGYHTLILIDGIRLNNSVFRSGPNQYSSTIDPLSVSSLEVVRGPSSVLHGSDAVGGVINVIPERRDDFKPGFNLNGSLHGRWSSAEDSFIGRIEIEGNSGALFGFRGGFSLKNFGDLSAGRGVGVQEETGYDEVDGDLRLDFSLSDDVWLTLAWQNVSQDDVPRTHKTIYGVSYHGTDVGSELERDLDQDRTLAYARLSVDGFLGVLDAASFTLSGQRQEQDRDRLRTGGRRDLSGFDVSTLGMSAQFEKAGSTGDWTFGTEYYRDNVDSYRRDYLNGVLTLEHIQGPVGDRAEYGLLGAFVQNQMSFGAFDLIAGARYTRASVHADHVDNPDVAGNDPSTPGNDINLSDRYSAAVGSLRGIYALDEEWSLFGGVSQGFRAPNLSDLTSFDSTSADEIPSPGLDPEYFLAFEAGVRTRVGPVQGQAVLWHTEIDDMIVQSPTGTGNEVQKDNVGDGFIHGIEAEASLDLTETWTALGSVSWMNGRVDQLDLSSGVIVDKPISRMLPLSGLIGLRYDPPDSSFWAMFETVMVDDQDQLALRDELDTSRIPEDGTPGYTVYNLRGGVDLSRDLSLTAALENITDKNYRIHGSGVNEPGLNLVLSVTYRF
jgi:hemoglobin/transferrin/lactoferrin receptor protein